MSTVNRYVKEFVASKIDKKKFNPWQVNSFIGEQNLALQSRHNWEKQIKKKMENMKTRVISIQIERLALKHATPTW